MKKLILAFPGLSRRPRKPTNDFLDEKNTPHAVTLTLHARNSQSKPKYQNTFVFLCPTTLMLRSQPPRLAIFEILKTFEKFENVF